MMRGAIILAGGRSSRMGSDKWLLRLGGLTVLERTASMLLSRVGQVTIVLQHGAKESVSKLPQTLRATECVSIIHDPMPDTGPLAGMLAGFTHAHSEYNLVAAGDLPFASWELAERLFAECEQRGAAAAVPEFGGRLHPLYAVYRRSALDSLTEYVDLGGRKVMDWLGGLKPAVLPEVEVRRVDPEGRALFNMNRPEDYEIAIRYFGQREQARE